MAEEENQSEFGAGVVVCLVKFAEHLGRDWPHNAIRNTKRWFEMTDAQQASVRAEIERYPSGDAAHNYGMLARTSRTHDDPVASVSGAIIQWANGASDHFYDLDRDKAPPSLISLADLAIEMGHGFFRDDWTFEDYERLIGLYKKACLDVDRLLGTEPDWGTY